MAVIVLQSDGANRAARAEMRRLGIDCTSHLLLRAARKIGIVNGLSVGDLRKSWDVLHTVRFIQEHVPADEPILDIGAYSSEVLCALHKMGYAQLTGVDLNPRLKQMPYSDKIHYVISDFMRMPFDDASFSAVSAISVIEHGLNSRRLLKELSRILKPGGYFIASMDYWPDKIDTRGIKAFGMDWMIFSKEDVCSLIDDAGTFDLTPCGTVQFDALDRVVSWRGKRYTFAWLALRKADGVSERPTA